MTVGNDAQWPYEAADRSCSVDHSWRGRRNQYGNGRPSYNPQYRHGRSLTPKDYSWVDEVLVGRVIC